MYVLTVICDQCDFTSRFGWRFNNNLTLLCATCTVCTDQYTLLRPIIDGDGDGTEGIIFNQNGLPPSPTLTSYYDTFYYNKNDGNFYYCQTRIEDIQFPLLYLNKTVYYRTSFRAPFSLDENAIVLLSDIEDYINNYDER